MMSTKVCRWKVVLLTLCAGVLSGNAARADWFYTFDDAQIPSAFKTQGLNPSGGQSTSFSASAQDGKLRLWDRLGITPANGGTWIAWGKDSEVFANDVRVNAQINALENTTDTFGILGRGADPLMPSYHVRYSFNPVDNPGRMSVAKMLASGEMLEVWAPGSVPPWTSRSYFLELEIIDDQMLGWPTITGRLFDHEGGTKLLEQSLIDSNLSGPAYKSGPAGVFAYSASFDWLNVSFDNIRAVTIPEPSTAVLLVMAAGGLVVCRWRRKRSP